MGGRSGSSSLGAGGGVPKTSVTTQDGTTLDLTDTPLIYGDKDPAVTGKMREALEAQEAKRLGAKIEYGLGIREDGTTIIKEFKGGKDSIRSIPALLFNVAAAFTHNHPRGKGEDGQLGGTFSTGDLFTFAGNKVKTVRASAAEGTYSITKTNKFNSTSFRRFMTDNDNKAQSAHRERMGKLADKVRNGQIKYDDYIKQTTKSFNTMLIDIHNGLRSGQKEHGYTYTLEER